MQIFSRNSRWLTDPLPLDHVRCAGKPDALKRSGFDRRPAKARDVLFRGFERSVLAQGLSGVLGRVEGDWPILHRGSAEILGCVIWGGGANAVGTVRLFLGSRAALWLAEGIT